MSTQNALELAARLRACGLALCKPDPGTKSPTYKGWPTRSLETGDFAESDLFGILCGPLSDGNRPGHALVVPDLDSLEAVEKADEFLPPTGMEEGRPGKPRDHRYYLVPLDSIPEWAWSQASQAAVAAKQLKGHPGPFKKGFNHAQTGKRLIDFLGTGGQVVCPSPGNQRAWVGGELGEPAVVPFRQLWDAICRLAVVCGGKVEQLHRPAPEARQAVQYHGENADAVALAIAHLTRLDPAVSGQDGHGRTSWPARVVCWGYDLGEELGFQLLRDHFNQRCQPPWSEKELRHKCHDANSLPFGKPRGWLLRVPSSRRSGRRTGSRPLSFTVEV
jgi:hypothetical protein